jgi:hypothetical protein
LSEYKYGRYSVEVCDNVEDGNLNVTGYGVFNTQNGVREYSSTCLHDCVKIARLYELLLRDALAKVETPDDTLWIKSDDSENLRPLN